ncbi:hypothetical protein AB0F81_43135 [Actinoplanes sp. NPDC024001]|uniref:hypothetical protein n=1 Tax=Actinoplanes sp. NPDC024001 TaxID=3154598 RepID=UPI0033D292AD
MAAGVVAWVIGVVLLGGSAILAPVLAARRRRGPAPPRLPADRVTADQVTADHHRVLVGADGLQVQVRGYGYAVNWAPRCALRWPEIDALVLETGTYDTIVSLYAQTRTDHFRKHLLDASAFDRGQWASLRDLVQKHTAGRLTIDLRPLGD